MLSDFIISALRSDKIEINPLEDSRIKEVCLSIPAGYEAQIRPRSGMFIKNGISANFGTIDSDYRGEILVLLINFSKNNFIIERGMRIAQIVFQKTANGADGDDLGSIIFKCFLASLSLKNFFSEFFLFIPITEL